METLEHIIHIKNMKYVDIMLTKYVFFIYMRKLKNSNQSNETKS